MTPNKRLARLRKLAQMTQFQLASATNINSAFISMFENGLRPLTAEQMAKVEDVLNDAIQAKASEVQHLIEMKPARVKTPSAAESRAV